VQILKSVNLKNNNMIKLITCSLVFIMFFVSAFMLTACENPNKTPMNIKEKYNGIIRKYNTENTNLFGDSENIEGNTVVVKYNNPVIESKIYDSLDVDDVSLRYRALSEIQANMLKYIFRYYEVWHQPFYEYAGEYNQKEINKFYDKVLGFEKSLARFNNAKLVFESEIDAIGNTSIVATTINKFTFEYNKLIETSFSLIDYFKSLHVKYIAGEDNHSLNSVQRMLDEAYYNIAKYIYYENILPLNYSTGSYGICDQVELMKNKANSFVMINTLNAPLTLLGDNITAELCETEFNDVLTNKFANIVYTCASFNQEFTVYLENYNTFDNYTLLRVKLNLFAGMNLNDYVNGFSPMNKIIYNFSNMFFNKTFVNYSYIFNEMLN